jgi:hypothetical protein
MPDSDQIFDWLNLPDGVAPISLWKNLHDAYVVSIRSSLLDRTVPLFCEVEHLRVFHKFPEGWQFILNLEGVLSARIARYAVWPGEFSIPGGTSRADESRMVDEYQAKWREESLTWGDFEAKVTSADEQVFDISDATLAQSAEGIVALQICGHLNHATYHVVFLRAQRLTISGNDGQTFALDQFLSFGEAYWEAFSRRRKEIPETRASDY